MVFLQLSDLHLAPPGTLVVGIDPMRQMQSVLGRITQLEVTPAFIVISGDLTENGSAESYEVVNAVLKELGGQDKATPVLLALGNHDYRATFRRVVLGEERADDQSPYYHSRLIDGLRVIVLDSLIPGQPGGSLGAAQLAWLEKELQMPAPRGTLIVLHHPCRLAGPVHHYPAFILREAAALEAMVARHRDRVVGVLAGHTHQANSAPFGGTLHATAPAVLRQLDFFSGEQYTTVTGGGFNLCQIDDSGLIVHPVLLPSEREVVSQPLAEAVAAAKAARLRQ
jgi:3',5'-cyclic-AMP phosphodiesterase